MRTPRVLVAAATLALAGTTAGTIAGAAPAGAGPAPSPAHRAAPTVTTIAKHLVGPLSVAQAPDGTRYWTDAFAGLLYRQAPGAAPTVVYKSKHHGADGVSADGGLLRFVTGSDDNRSGGVWTLDAAGAPVLLGDTWKYEKRNNPDGAFRYGFLRTPRSCLAQLPKQVPGAYRGAKETHSYAVTTAADGTAYVADAGANDILALSPSGQFRTVAALKPVKVKVTASAAQANHLPRCTVGRTYALEAVPTDIELGPDGWLYVTSLPGGPEDGSLGANGRVLKVNPATGKVRTVVRGLVSPTGVAVAADGDLYVAQLFRGEISRVRAGSTKVRPYLRVALPAAVEVTPTGLLATTHALPGRKPKGRVVAITP